MILKKGQNFLRQHSYLGEHADYDTEFDETRYDGFRSPYQATAFWTAVILLMIVAVVI